MLFWLRKLFVDFRRFRVFVFCHKAYSKTRKPRKIFRSSFFEVLILFIWFRALSQAFCVFMTKLSRCCSKYQEALTIEPWNWLFLLLKTKWYVDKNLIAFQQFSSNIKAFRLGLLDLESFLLISGVSGFSFFAIEHIRKPGNHEKFSEAHFLRY